MENYKQHENEKKTKFLSNSFYRRLYILLGVVLVAFAAYNLVQGASFGTIYDEKLADVMGASRPALVELIAIKDNHCADCFDIDPVIDSVKKANVNITNEKILDLRSTDAKELIDKYSIEKVPVIVVVGEIDKINLRNLDKKDDALLFTQLTPPYTDANTNIILGRVSSTILEDSSCDKCSDFSSIIDALKKSGVEVVSEKVVERRNTEGAALINKYGLKVLPTLIISHDLSVYNPEITRGWNSIGSIESDGSYVTRSAYPPYLNLSTNKVDGLVSMTVLGDGNCKECYNPDDFHKPILQRMGVVFEDEKRVDVSDPNGASLIKKYQIKKIPTIILEGDVGNYPILVEAWKDVGSVEPDGAYIFRNVEVAQQAYKDLSTNKVIEPNVEAG